MSSFRPNLMTSRRPRLVWFALVLGVVVGSGLPLPAHESPEDVVQSLTQRLEKEGARQELYVMRATEFRALGRHAEAIRDLESALQLKPGVASVERELASLHLAKRDLTSALAVLNLRLAPESQPELDPAERRYFRQLRGLVLEAQGQHEAALADYEAGFPAKGATVDVYLIRSRMQSRLGHHTDAARGLRQGHEATGSFVLREQWIDALIEAGDHNRALEEIDVELEACRWRSAWLIRKARIHAARTQTDLARQELKLALTEIETRLRTVQPDLALLVERGMAHQLLGRERQARQDLVAARNHGASPWMLERLERLIRGPASQ